MLNAEEALRRSNEFHVGLKGIMEEIERRANIGLTSAIIKIQDIVCEAAEDTNYWKSISGRLIELGYKVTVKEGRWLKDTLIIIEWSDAS
jgi:hypothetical protein